MLRFRAIVMATLMGGLVLYGSLGIQASQELCEIKVQTTDPSYTKYQTTQQLHDSLDGMSAPQRDSISNLAADTIASEENGISNNYGYIGYGFTSLTNMIKASLGVYC